MRVLFETCGFVLCFLGAAAVCTLAIWILGSPLKLEFRDSIAFSFISLAIVLPSTANFWILFRGLEGEGVPQRLLAGIRGFGMLICAIALFVAMATISIPLASCVWLFAIGSVLWWGSLPLALWLQHRR